MVSQSGGAGICQRLNLIWVICMQMDKASNKMIFEAVKWFRKAAEQGYAKAQGRLGNVYSDGIGVKQDDF
ncbi:Putative TPR repeat protein [Haemophilus influenzae]|uniref:TPR repeat protein n=1 Tax=Haemophilus influenzae TaxID=727 RepID=A0A2X1RM25_HAEIF|nr:Putative TPR repeat protein [Haemophilus influenzae]